MRNCLKIVVAGDVDAGKSTLIGRFLYESGSVCDGVIGNIEESCLRNGRDFEFAYLLDSFEEERENQLTIDTTQVFCRDKKGREWIFIDVPGHKELIKNMLVGSSYADIALLVVDARESLKEQAKRHIQVLKFLEIGQFIVVINKMDKVGYNKEVFMNEKAKICAFFDKLNIKPGYCIPVSAKEGENFIKNSLKMSWHKGETLIKALSINCRKNKGGNFRLPIQDIYRLGSQNIAVGMIISGRIRTGEKVTILPSGKESKVKQIKVFNKDFRSAAFPENIGLILDGNVSLKRGMILCKPKLPNSGTAILAKIFCVRALKINESLRFKSVTQDVVARIKQIIVVRDSVDLEVKPQADSLQELDLAEVRLNMESPAVTERFQSINSLGRFVLENQDKEICAAGIIL